ncbi:hypothetical protein HWV62_15006 [Athelia sp. TMB]|nr:hypothetical protein HWV62_15006 [Athelia sp. TMB]
MTSRQSTVLATLSECCIKGHKHNGDPAGGIIKLAGLDTYIAEPTKEVTGPKKVLIFLSDVYGSQHINAMLLQDQFAHNPGWNVEDTGPWGTEKLEAARETFPQWIEALKEKFGQFAFRQLHSGWLVETSNGRD